MQQIFFFFFGDIYFSILVITAVLIAHTESRYGSEGVKFSLIGVTTVALVFTLLELMMWLYTAAETGCMLSQ